jgi:hypothetical protein
MFKLPNDSGGLCPNYLSEIYDHTTALKRVRRCGKDHLASPLDVARIGREPMLAAALHLPISIRDREHAYVLWPVALAVGRTRM